MLRAHAIRRDVRERSKWLETDPSQARSEILRRLNVVWRDASTQVPYWRALRAERRLPESFDSLEAYVDAIPPTTRAMLQHHPEELSSGTKPPEYLRITGGSTAEPVQIRSWKSELAVTRADMWIGRAWYGVDSAEPLLLLWGHAHLLGAGWRGYWNARKREAFDRALGFRRVSAYDLRPERMRDAAQELLRFRPSFVIGYSVALDAFARANTGLRDELRRAGIKVVIATGEGFPDPASADEIADLFGCPVGMEYGAVETGVVAHTHPSGGFRVLWHSHLLDVEPGKDGHAVRVTSLFPRCTPLLRYELGDEIALDEDASPTVGITRFERVLGRSHDYIETPDGAQLHSELFTHAVRGVAEIRGYQFVQLRDSIELRYLSDADLSEAAASHITARLTRVHPWLAGLTMRRVDHLERTVAGKTRMIVKPTLR